MSIPATLKEAGEYVPATEGDGSRVPTASTSEYISHAFSWNFIVISANRSYCAKEFQHLVTFIPAVLNDSRVGKINISR